MTCCRSNVSSIGMTRWTGLSTQGGTSQWSPQPTGASQTMMSGTWLCSVWVDVHTRMTLYVLCHFLSNLDSFMFWNERATVNCSITFCTSICTACCSPLTGPTSWPTFSTPPGLTMECPSTLHHWSSLVRKWGRCTATAEHPWWCTAGERVREVHVFLQINQVHYETTCVCVRTLLHACSIVYIWYAFLGYSLEYVCPIVQYIRRVKVHSFKYFVAGLLCMFEFCNWMHVTAFKKHLHLYYINSVISLPKCVRM